MVKKCYRLYVTTMALLWITAAMTAPAFAVDDMWTVANKIIVDVLRQDRQYQHVTGRVDVRCGRYRSQAFQQSAQGRSGMGLAQTHLDCMGHHQRHRRLHCIRRAAVQRPCNADAVIWAPLRHEGGANIA